MSKEIAQTVGGKKFAWLIALIAAFAVFATVGSQWRQADATVATDESVMATHSPTDSVIPIDQTISKEVAAAPHATAPDLIPVDNYLRFSPSSTQMDSSQTLWSGTSSLVTNVTNRDLTLGVLSHNGANSPLAAAVASLPVHQEGSSNVAVSKTSGVKYALYAIVTLIFFGALAFASLVTSPLAMSGPATLGFSSLSSRKGWISKRFGAPTHWNTTT